MIDRIYLVRHGCRKAWVDDTWYDASLTGISKDDPLDELGEVPAVELANHLSVKLPQNERPTAIFCSPYYRCLQTVKPISQSLKLPIYVEHGLSEWRSKLLRTGLHAPHVPASVLETYFPEIDTSWAPVWFPSRNGKNIQQIHERLAGFINTFLPEVQRRLPIEQHKRILLVSHAAPIIALMRGLVQDRELPIKPACCSLTKVIPSKEGGWEIEILGDGSYLGGASGDWRQWGFEDLGPEYGKDHPNVADIEVDVTAGSQVESMAL